MPGEHAAVRVVQDRRLDPAAEQLVGLAHEVLVERVLARDEHREPVLAPAGTAPLLAERGDGAGEADRDHRVEQADVDPELERVRRRDAEEVTGREPSLDLAPLLRRVAGPVGREPRVVAEPVGGEAVHELGCLAALRERERPQAPLDECRLQLRRLGERGPAQAELGIEQRRVPEHDRPAGPRGRVGVDHGDVRSEQAAAELAGVGDGRRGEQELGLGAVDPGEPPQPPQDVRDVRPEDAAIHVRLVENDEAQAREQVAPALVVREQPDVHHVRVRQDEVGRAADQPPLLGRGVPVVDRRPQPRHAVGAEGAELILGERLRRVEVERTASRVAREGVQHRQVEGERLAGSGSRGDDDVLAPCGRLPRGELVRVQPFDADRRPHARVELGRQRCRARRPRGLLSSVGELLAGQELVDRRRRTAGGHLASVADPLGSADRGVRWAEGYRG